MNKRFLSVMILGVLFSPPVMAAQAQSVVLWERSGSARAEFDESVRLAGENSLSQTAGEGAECAAVENARRAALERMAAQGSGSGGGTSRAAI